MAADASVSVPEGPANPLPAPSGAGRWRRHAVTAIYLGPALVFLAVWIVYPTIRTVIRSFFDRSGDNFVWFDNYKTLFTSDTLVKAIENNAIWLAVVPATVVAIGLIFAVLTERVRWSVAFKIVVFMPMAISMFAAGVIWHIMFQKDPDQGAVNAAIKVVKDAVTPSGVLTSANASTPQLIGRPGTGFVLKPIVRPGDTALLGLTAIPPTALPADAQQAAAPRPQRGAVTGTIWRDFRPGGGKPGVVERAEQGIPGATVELRDVSGDVVKTTTSRPDGTFAFEGLEPGSYRAAVGKDTFAKPFDGVA